MNIDGPPIAVPDAGDAASPRSLAIPKSRILIVGFPPETMQNMFSGLMSRCAIFSSCATASALAAGSSRVTASRSERVRRARISAASVRPSSHSRTR